MDNNQKLIVALLVLAILFSTVSIFTSLVASNLDIPKPSASPARQVTSGKGVAGTGFFVEGNSLSGGRGG